MGRPAMITMGLFLGCSEAPVDAVQSYADDICDCASRACIEGVRAEWEQDHGPRMGGAALSETDRARYLEAMNRALECQSMTQG